jgi:hypothetical protein
LNAVTTDEGETLYCDEKEVQRPDPGEDNLAPLLRSELKCEFVKAFKTPVSEFFLICRNIVYSPTQKVKPKKTNVQRGQGHSSNSPQIRNSSPLANRMNGPSGLIYESGYEVNVSQKKGPLTAENKDLSQCSIEYDRYGNLIGFNFQLNKEGNALADPDSKESGIDSRWSWNAIASPIKGFLNKLLIK